VLYISLIALLAWAVPAEAGGYDNPGFLTSHLVSGGPPKDGIPALTNPNFVDPERIAYLREDDLVMGLVFDGDVRAYPHNIGWWNEIINDQFTDRSVAVTLCPLTGTGLVFDATGADGMQIEFGVSGLLINSNLVMYDRRDGSTLYPQMIYTAINGGDLGAQLELLPVIETTWGMWKKMYPNTTVVEAGTGWERYAGERPVYTERSYENYPYISARLGDYRTSNDYLIFLPSTADIDPRFEIKDMVLGLCLGKDTKAYPFNAMPDGAVINDVIDAQNIAVVYAAESHTAIAYFSELGGRVLNFYAVEPEGNLTVEFVDVETGWRWNMLGSALEGPLAGQQLKQVPSYNSMWFAWAAYWPDTNVWSGEGILDVPVLVDTAVEETPLRPQTFALGQNFPNPFNPETRIHYQLPADGFVRLVVYNSGGQVVRRLVDGVRRSGLHVARWNGLDEAGQAAASGTYIYRLEMPGEGLREIRSMSLVR